MHVETDRKFMCFLYLIIWTGIVTNGLQTDTSFFRTATGYILMHEKSLSLCLIQLIFTIDFEVVQKEFHYILVLGIHTGLLYQRLKINI